MNAIINITGKWVYKLCKSTIQSSATAGLASLGISGAHAAGIDVAHLERGQLVSIVVAGAIVGLLKFLSVSPLPPVEGNGNVSGEQTQM